MIDTRKISLDPSSINTLSWLRVVIGIDYLREKALGKKVDVEKKEILERLSEAYSPEKLDKAFKGASRLLDAQKSALLSCGYVVFDFLGVTRSRLIVGMASDVFGKQIFEVGLSWDPLLNLPYIPASSLKGAFKSYVEEMKRQDLVSLLGTKEEASSVVFLNSYPVSSKYNLLVPEVTTPIYREQEEMIRETRAKPNPVIYPVVNKDVTFRILIGVKSEKKDISDQLRLFLGDVLERGIGAKTLLGYGIIKGFYKISERAYLEI
ncbi:MAG: type III-B CRISPR module RAMP protein Cmr6 [Candidatus Methanodesulfokora washburnensis]|jgi:CRISPR-associated protein Cmr6